MAYLIQFRSPILLLRSSITPPAMHPNIATNKINESTILILIKNLQTAVLLTFRKENTYILLFFIIILTMLSILFYICIVDFECYIKTKEAAAVCGLKFLNWKLGLCTLYFNICQPRLNKQSNLAL